MSTGKKPCFVSGFHVGTGDYYTRPLKRDIRAAPERKSKDPKTGRTVVSCTCGFRYIYIYLLYILAYFFLYHIMSFFFTFYFIISF